MSKTIRVSKDTWKNLVKLKIEMNAKSIDEMLKKSIPLIKKHISDVK